MRNVYSIFGDEGHLLSVPAAHQVTTAKFGVDIGGVKPAFFAYVPEARYDSWLTVSVGDGAVEDRLSSVGIDFGAWTADARLESSGGAIFWDGPGPPRPSGPKRP